MLNIDVNFKNEEELTSFISIANVPIDFLNTLDEAQINELFEYKYYMNTNYDHVELIGLHLLITKKTKSSVNMICLEVLS